MAMWVRGIAPQAWVDHCKIVYDRDDMSIDLLDWQGRIIEARDRIQEMVRETPVALIEGEKAFGPGRAYLKLEHLQTTGSFKLRGAANKVLSLSPDVATRGVVTSSTGNHGLGVAAASRHRGIEVEIFVSPQVSPKKLRRMEEYGARIRQAGCNPLEAELAARAAAQDSGRTYVSPYNDAWVVAGQGTVALELARQIGEIDAIYVAVGGGGLIGGIGVYAKSISPKTRIVGCWPANSRVMYECLRAGKVIEFPEQPTLSESTAGGVEPGSITFELCQRVIDNRVLVSETEILEAMRWAYGRDWKIEGAAAVAIAAFFQQAPRHHNQTVAIISCGGNTSPEVLAQM
jgi:threonine dehydratase